MIRRIVHLEDLPERYPILGAEFMMNTIMHLEDRIHPARYPIRRGAEITHLEDPSLSTQLSLHRLEHSADQPHPLLVYPVNHDLQRSANRTVHKVSTCCEKSWQ